jgi:hypothetical protein
MAETVPGADSASTSARSALASLPSLPSPSLGDEWPRQATDAVVNVVDAVREKTTGPAVNAAHAIKYGIVAAVTGSVLGVIVLIGLIRGSEALLQVIGTWLGYSWLADPIWIVYLFYGVVFCVVGLILFRRANQPAKLG